MRTEFPCDPTRIDLLFTMSENTHGASDCGQRVRIDVSRTMMVTGQSEARLRSYELRRARFGFPAWPRHAKPSGEAWWSQTGSNRRPHACKARALPAELWPRNQKTNAAGLSLKRHMRAMKWWAWEDLNFRPHAYQARALTN